VRSFQDVAEGKFVQLTVLASWPANQPIVLRFRSSRGLDRYGDKTCARRCVWREFTLALMFVNPGSLSI
jgi:hypothetical protein